jgi:hypothetical protein
MSASISRMGSVAMVAAVALLLGSGEIRAQDKVRNHLPDGKVTEAELVPGQATYRDATTHWAENIGTTTIRLIIVELKEHP